MAEILLTIKFILNTLYTQEREEDYTTFSILKCACLLYNSRIKMQLCCKCTHVFSHIHDVAFGSFQ